MPDALPPPEIHDRGRGPEIKGTRITVFDVMDYHPKHPPAWIAELFSLPLPHIELAIRYIEEHRVELIPAYESILERSARGNPPEVQRIADRSLGLAHRKLQELRAARPAVVGDSGASDHG